MLFFMEKKVFIAGFTVLFLVVDGKVKVCFMAFDFSFGVWGLWWLKKRFVFYGVFGEKGRHFL